MITPAHAIGLGGQLRSTTPEGWVLLVAIAIVPTSLAISLFLAALPAIAGTLVGGGPGADLP